MFPSRSGNRVVEVGVALFDIILSDAQEYFVFPILAALGSAGLNVFFPKMWLSLAIDTITFH